MANGHTLSQLAKAAEIPASTLRYYERIELVEPEDHMNGFAAFLPERPSKILTTIGTSPMNNDMLDLMRSEEGKLAMERSSNLWEMTRTAFRLLPKMGDMMRRQLHDAWESTRTVSPDLILFRPKMLGAKDFSEKLGVHSALAFYLPMFVATGDFPAMWFPRLRIGRWYNRLTYRLIDLVTRMATGWYLKKWRKDHGLARSRGRYLQRSDGSSVPALHAFSESVIPRPKDWPDTAVVTGYWIGMKTINPRRN